MRPRTVWILGAGFPRSLGAPLLADLFRQEQRFEIHAFFPEEKFAGLARDMEVAQAVFNWGRDHEHLWQDPEEFLVFLDDAFADGQPARRARLKNLTDRVKAKVAGPELFYRDLSGDAQPILSVGLQRAARRALAAESTRFMMTSRDGELWLPYRKWTAGLRPETDTIVTFNYDLLLDELGKGGAFTIPMPHEEPEPKKIPVFKLHGSADWVAEGDKHIRRGEFEALAQSSGSHPGIAAPGRSKSPDGKPPFHPLWERAEKAIAEAGWVIFIGYRFPPTDALARDRLMNALANPESPNFRRIDTVLGPQTGSDDSRRLLALLEAASGSRALFRGDLTFSSGSRLLYLYQQPLWAQDFLTTYTALSRDQRWSF